MDEQPLTNEELTQAFQYLRLKIEALEERHLTHGHNVLGDTTGTPVPWSPPVRQQTSPLPPRLTT